MTGHLKSVPLQHIVAAMKLELCRRILYLWGNPKMIPAYYYKVFIYYLIPLTCYLKYVT